MVIWGAAVNAILVVIGTIVGIFLGKYIKENIQESITKALGLVVIYISVMSMLDEASTMNVLLSMALGALIGEWIDLDGKIVKLGNWLQEKLKGGNSFSKGFAQATLLFCVGSMAILGALESGLQNSHTTLTAKGIIDGIVAIFFAAESGIGVGFSAVCLLIYEGGMALMAGLLSPLLTTEAISSINCVGGIILLSVGLNMLGISKFKSMNFIPAILITVILTMLNI